MGNKFKFEHHTVVYNGGGQYTLTADPGYVLQRGQEQLKEVNTRDYTKWTAVECQETPAEAPAKAARRTKRKK